MKKLILYRSDVHGRNESQNIEECSEQNCRKSLLIPPLQLPAHFFETPAQFKAHFRPNQQRTRPNSKPFPCVKPTNGTAQQPFFFLPKLPHVHGLYPMISCLHCRPGNVTSLLQNGHARDCFSPTCLAAQQAAPHASLTSAWPFPSCSIPMETHLHQNARKSAVSAHKQQLPVAPHAVSRMVFLLTSCSPCLQTSRLPFTRQQPMHLPQQLLTNSPCVCCSTGMIFTSKINRNFRGHATDMAFKTSCPDCG